MERNQVSKLGRWATLAVSSNLALLAVLFWLLPQEAHVLLPLVALAAPLLTAAVLEQALRSQGQGQSLAKVAARGPAPAANSCTWVESFVWRKSA